MNDRNMVMTSILWYKMPDQTATAAQIAEMTYWTESEPVLNGQLRPLNTPEDLKLYILNWIFCSIATQSPVTDAE